MDMATLPKFHPIPPDTHRSTTQSPPLHLGFRRRLLLWDSPPLLTHGSSVQPCRSFRQDDDDNAEATTTKKKKNISLDRSKLFGAVKSFFFHKDNSIEKLEEILSRIALHLGRYIVTTMSTRGCFGSWIQFVGLFWQLDSIFQERDMAEKEVERLRHMVRRQRKELKARMLEVSREEAERKRMLDERSNYRHKQVMLDAYDQQCDEAARIFSEYHKRLITYVNQVKDSQRVDKDSSMEVATSYQIANDKGDVYSTVYSTVKDSSMEVATSYQIYGTC